MRSSNEQKIDIPLESLLSTVGEVLSLQPRREIIIIYSWEDAPHAQRIQSAIVKEYAGSRVLALNECRLPAETDSYLIYLPGINLVP